MTTWTLIDDLLPLEHEDDEPPHIPITTEEELRAELLRMSQRRPAIVDLMNPHSTEEECLLVGVGGPYGGVQWSKAPHSINFKQAVADQPAPVELIEFSCQGSDMGFDRYHLLPLDLVIQIAAYYFRERRLAPWIKWKQWNSQTKRMEVVETAP